MTHSWFLHYFSLCLHSLKPADYSYTSEHILSQHMSECVLLMRTCQPSHIDGQKSTHRDIPVRAYIADLKSLIRESVDSMKEWRRHAHRALTL